MLQCCLWEDGGEKEGDGRGKTHPVSQILKRGYTYGAVSQTTLAS